MSSTLDVETALKKSQNWQKILKAALEADTWGDIEEAAENYEKLVRALELDHVDLGLNKEEKKTLLNIRQCLVLRMEQIKEGKASKGLALKDIKLLVPVFENLFRSPIKHFPIDLTGYSKASDVLAAPPAEIVADGDGNNLKKEERKEPEVLSAEDAAIHVYVEKIGLKDAKNYIEACMRVSIVDKTGRVLEQATTPCSTSLKPTYVNFGHDVYFKTPLKRFHGMQCSVFFEFLHTKPKKKKVSTRCFAFIEAAELEDRDGEAVALELYKKPTNFKKKNLQLHTVKPLYVHTTITALKKD